MLTEESNCRPPTERNSIDNGRVYSMKNGTVIMNRTVRERCYCSMVALYLPLPVTQTLTLSLILTLTISLTHTLN